MTAEGAFLFSTNKSLLRLTASDNFKKWLIENGKPEYAHKAGVAPEYFLVDSEFEPSSLDNLVVVANARESILKSCFESMFVSQMTNLGLVQEEWPDVTDFDTFIDFYDLEYVCFGGDVGMMPFRCEKNIEDSY